MPLQKNSINISFGEGLDLKTDPFQVSPGKFLSLENRIFQKGGLLQKRNGYQELTSLPNEGFNYLTTFNGDLTAIGINLSAYSTANKTWQSKGTLQPLSLSVLSLIKSGANQIFCDSVTAPNGLVCLVYLNENPSANYYFVISDSVTGQNFLEPQLISSLGSPRVFLLGNNFVIIYASGSDINYIAIPITTPLLPGSPVTIVSNYVGGSGEPNFDGAVSNNTLFVAYNANDVGFAIRAFSLSSGFVIAVSPPIGPSLSGTLFSVTIDQSDQTVWFTWSAGAQEAWFMATDNQFNPLAAFHAGPTYVPLSSTAFSANILTLTSSAQNGVLTAFFEIDNSYSYGSMSPTHYLQKINVTEAGVITDYSGVPFIRSVGLASKSFILNGIIYVLSAFESVYQPSYFLIDSNGNIISKLAYSNGGGYLTLGLPSVSVNGVVAKISYLFKDLVEAANTSLTALTNTPVYSQTGINLVSFDFNQSEINSSEIGNNLFVTGGLLWDYDGTQVVEQGFNVWPDPVFATISMTGGSMTAQPYFYQAVYEWTDNQGNVQRSSPSIAVKVDLTSMGDAVDIYVPTLRLTYKTMNPVKLTVYRWSTMNPIFYEINATYINSPVFNDLSVDDIKITDTAADKDIIGNAILYTTGGVIENIGAPPTSLTTLFGSRLFLVDAEDQNLLWFSKQVIEATTVELSDLFTIFVSPTIGAQGNTGPITSLSAMDDKLIIFKKDALYYLTGVGPDNTGANNDFSSPIFITSTVGSTNQRSLVLMPQGIMFQSDKGIWLLGRDLSTQYIGAPVESLTQNALVQSSVTVPGTNQVRFTLDSGITLIYDYFYGQWGTFTGVPALSSTLFQGLHTFINTYDITPPSPELAYTITQTFQETPGVYLDGSKPVLTSLTTSWLNLAGLQGYERAYFFYLLATYLSPHKLNIQIAYDYNPAIVQNLTITPNNFSPNYGGDSIYGGGTPYGGSSNVEQWRIFFAQQKCEAFQITLTEIYDPSFGVPAGAGFSLSGFDLVIGAKSGYPRLSAATQTG